MTLASSCSMQSSLCAVQEKRQSIGAQQLGGVLAIWKLVFRSSSICLVVVCVEKTNKQKPTCSAWAIAVAAMLHMLIVCYHLLSHFLPPTTQVNCCDLLSCYCCPRLIVF